MPTHPDKILPLLVRLTQKIRALAYRDGEFMRFISLHPDHDSAYE